MSSWLTVFAIACSIAATVSSGYLRLGETECEQLQHQLSRNDTKPLWQQVDPGNVTTNNQTSSDNKTRKKEIVRSRRYLHDTCRDAPLAPFRVLTDSVDEHPRLCPVVRVCTRSLNRFPSYIVHYTCRQRTGYIGDMLFECRNETRMIDILKRVSCDGDEPAERLKWEHEMVTVGCTARYINKTDAPVLSGGARRGRKARTRQ